MHPVRVFNWKTSDSRGWGVAFFGVLRLSIFIDTEKWTNIRFGLGLGPLEIDIGIGVWNA